MRRIRKYDNKDKSIKITSERRGYKLRREYRRWKEEKKKKKEREEDTDSRIVRFREIASDRFG